MNFNVEDDIALGIPEELSQSETFRQAIVSAFQLGEEFSITAGGPLREYAEYARNEAFLAIVDLLRVKTTDVQVLAAQQRARPYVDLMEWAQDVLVEGKQAAAALDVEDDRRRRFEEESRNGE